MRPPQDIDAGTVGDALDVVHDLALWELGPESWQQIEVLLGRVATALARYDAEGLADAVDGLEDHRPPRITRIGSTGRRGIPEPVLERRNTLVHALIREQRAGAESGRDAEPTR